MKEKRQGGFLIAKIHQASGRIFARKLRAHGLEQINPAQGRILFVLWQKDNVPIQQLAEKTSLSKSTMTSMLDRLEASGHIQRVSVSKDRRQVLIRLTKKDRKMKALYSKVSAEMTQIFYKGFDSREIERFESSLARIMKNLDEAEKQL